MSVCLVGFDLDDVGYQDLLRDYLRDRLEADYTDERADLIIKAADNRFAYVSFLAERWLAGRLDEAILAGVGHDGDARGEALYEHWLDDLERTYGSKRADKLKHIVAILAAMEDIHASVFGPDGKIDQATGAPLTILPETFDGVPLMVIASLMGMDRPNGTGLHDSIDAEP